MTQFLPQKNSDVLIVCDRFVGVSICRSLRNKKVHETFHTYRDYENFQELTNISCSSQSYLVMIFKSKKQTIHWHLLSPKDYLS